MQAARPLAGDDGSDAFRANPGGPSPRVRPIRRIGQIPRPNLHPGQRNHHRIGVIRAAAHGLQNDSTVQGVEERPVVRGLVAQFEIGVRHTAHDL
jgi:hypothetical protein